MNFIEKNNGTIITNNIYANNIYSGSTDLTDIFTLKSNNIISKTYVELYQMVSNSGLTIGQKYLLSDFSTKHNILDGNTVALDTYIDWYLPSNDEMEQVIFILYFNDICSFGYSEYWTSSENNSNQAITYQLGGSNDSINKDQLKGIRPITDFISNSGYTIGQELIYGYIFHIETLSPTQYKYYVCSKTEYETEKYWQSSYSLLGSSGRTIGEGKSNTQIIVSGLTLIPEYNKAAQYCNDLIIYGDVITNTGNTEPLILNAISATELDKLAQSTIYNEDIIYYDITGGDIRDIAFF